MFFVLHAWYNKINLIYTRSIREYRIGATTTVISAFSAAIGLSEGITIMIKLWVQRRRPNFYDLCGFDPTTKKCTANIKHIREVRNTRALVFVCVCVCMCVYCNIIQVCFPKLLCRVSCLMISLFEIFHI